MSRRGVAPVVGIALLVAVTVVLAAVVGAFAIGVGSGTDDAPQAAISAEFGNEYPNQINFTHEGGDALGVRNLTIKIFVDSEPLEQQPDVPATGMDGFRYSPSGPFNSQSDNTWTAGETASLIVATTTNSPQPSDGSQVTVKIYSNGEAVTTTQV